jgi:hypothetical protein
MKPKYASLTMVLLIVVMLGLGITYELHLHKTESDGSRHGRARPLSEIKVPDKPILSKMDRLERRMHLLSAPPSRVVRQTDLSALGYVPVSHTMAGMKTGSSQGARASEHRVTMAFDGRVKRFCIINRKLYPEGGVLPDGATIIKIESRRVLIAKESLQQWLAVDFLIGATTEPEESS